MRGLRLGLGLTGGVGAAPLSFSTSAATNPPSLVIDRKRNTYFWGGSAKTASNLTADSTGWTMSDVSWLNPSVGWTVLVEWDQPAQPTIAQNAPQTIFSLARVASGAHRFDVTADSQNLVQDSRRGQPTAIYGAGGTNRTYIPLLAKPYDTDVPPTMGRRRVAFSLSPSNALMASDGYDVSSGTALGIIPVFDRVNIGFRQLATTKDRYFAGNVDSISVYAWPFQATQAQIETLMATSQEGIPPLHVLGDSFGNGNWYENEGGLVDDIRRAGQNYGSAMWSDDCVGSTSLTQQAVRFAGTPRWWNSTLISIEMGLEDSGADYCTALDSIIAHLPHGRWLFLEPCYGNGHRLGSQGRIDLDAKVTTIKAHLTAIGKLDHWVDTKAGMQAAARAGNATDTADIADDIWPSDTTYWSLDGLHRLHPANVVLAGIIKDALVAKGWL